jgi:nicotinamidase-related amidase
MESAFHRFVGTDLDVMLRSNGIRTILIGGVATEGSVEGTARSAPNLGYDIVVLRDCVGSRSRELHELMEQTHFDIASASETAVIRSQAQFKQRLSELGGAR